MHKAFDVSGPAEIDIRLASGDVDIDPTLDGRVEIDLVAHDEESQRLVDEARIELHDHHGRPQLVVDVPQRNRGFSFSVVFGRSGITCRVRCPEGSLVSVRTKSADTQARGRYGEIDVRTASGDVHVDEVRHSLRVKSASGDVAVQTVYGQAEFNTASGDLHIQRAAGPVKAALVSGDVYVGEAGSSVSANTVSGDIRLDAVREGSVELKSISGDVLVAVRRGSRVYVDVNTVSGSTRSEFDLSDAPPPNGGADASGPLVEIFGKTVSGDVSIERAAAGSTTSELTEP